LELPKVKNDKKSPQEYSSECIKDKSNMISKKIFILSIVLSLMVGILCGSVSGYLLGRKIFSQASTPSTENSEYSKYDYSQFVVNEAKNITIADLYSDDEERYYAMQLIGMKMPELKFVDSKDTVYTTQDIGSSEYILEIVHPTCNFCKGMVPIMDEYRKSEKAHQLIGLSMQDGQLDTFNAEAETTFVLMQKDQTTAEFMNNLIWVPMFIYVKDGIIEFVSFGNIEEIEELQQYIDIAFN
jgi:hypothetical protein